MNTNEFIKAHSRKIEPRARDAQVEPPDNTQDYAPILFPVHALPPPLAKFVTRAYEVFGFPMEFTGLMVCMVFAVSCGNRYHIGFKRNFIQSAILFGAIIGAPNTAKSPVFSFTTEVLRRRERKLFAQYQAEKERYDEWESMTTAERKEAGGSKTPKPRGRQLITSDATLEGLYETWRNNPHGLIYLSDELMSWYQSISKYNSGNDTSHFLSMWSGSSISITRRTGRMFVERPFLCICGGVQPDLLKNLFKGDNAHNGLPDRFLYSQVADFDIPLKSLDEIEPEVVEGYERAVERVLGVCFDNNFVQDTVPELDSNGEIVELGEQNSDTTVLEMTDEAKTEYMNWANGGLHRTRLLQEQNESYARALGKYDLICLRLALIVQVMRWAVDEADLIGVDEVSVRRSIILTEYFKAQAERVFRLAVDSDARLGMSSQVRKIYDELPERFTTAQMITTAKQFGMSKRSVNRLLKNEAYFRKESYGHYEKTT